MINVPRGNRLAEFIGIMLRDGSLPKTKSKSYLISISFNSATEKDYVQYVEELIHSLFGIKFRIVQHKNRNCCELVKGCKELRLFLETAGLKVGNKVKNQVGVPSWIKEKRETAIACLRGLIDTDGSIYLSREEYISINFKNFSYPLLDDFKELCSIIGIKCVHTSNDVNINSKRSVKYFLDTVQPFKWLRMKHERSLIEKLLEYKINYPERSGDRKTRVKNGTIVKVELDKIKEIYDDLKSKGYSGYDIDEISNSNFRNSLYSGISCFMELKSFNELQRLRETSPIVPVKTLPIELFKKMASEKTLEEMVIETGTSRKSVIRRYHRNNIPFHPTAIKRKSFMMSREELQYLVWKEPMSEIAKKHGVSVTAVRNLCIKLDINLPSRGYWNKDREYKRKLDISKEELEKLVWEIPATKIAEKYGVSGRLITKRCRQLGIEKPPRGYWAKKRAKN